MRLPPRQPDSSRRHNIACRRTDCASGSARLVFASLDGRPLAAPCRTGYVGPPGRRRSAVASPGAQPSGTAADASCQDLGPLAAPTLMGRLGAVGGAAQDPRDRATSPAFDSWVWRGGNAIVGVLARAGIGPIQLLTTRGRRTGRPHTVPVVPVEHAGQTWLVAPYGPVGWVRNVREDERVRLRYGRATRDYTAREVGPDEAAPVLKRYVAVATKTRTQFGAAADSPVADFAAETDRHPVFELTPLRGDAAVG